MKIFRLSQRMFNTYGMEDLLLASFKRHHANFIKNGTWYLQHLLDEGEILKIGTMRIGSLLKQIIEKHGIPFKANYPKIVTFCLASTKNKLVGGKEISAFFADRPQYNSIYIVKVIDNIKDLKLDESLKSTLQHELQHLIANMYNPSGVYGGNRSGTIEYYLTPHEVQAFCSVIARQALDNWKDTLEYALRKWTPEKILNQIQIWRTQETVSSLVNIFLLPSFRNFDASKDNVIGSNQKLKDTYLYYSYRNFELLLTQYLNELESKVSEEINSENS